MLPLLDADIRLRIAGTVWDAAEADILSEPRVDFLGPVFGESLAELRRSAIVVVMPNVRIPGPKSFEGFGLNALETVADGGILCAAQLNGIVDAVRDGETGFLLPPGDARVWADKIAELAQWPAARRAKFLRKAQVVIDAEYSWQRVAAETLAVYRRDDSAAAARCRSAGLPRGERDEV